MHLRMKVRAWFVFSVLALALPLLLAGKAHAQRQSIDCASSALPMPAGFSGECYSQNERGTGNYGCSVINYQIRAADGQPGPRFFSQLRIGTRGCALADNNPLGTLKGLSPIPRDAKNWSDQRKGDGSDVYWTFDRSDQNPNGKCFAYYRTGPPVPKSRTPGFEYFVVGFFCKPPGQPLDDGAARSILSRVKVTSR